ncbi:hypothetical protein Desku_0832 [Desulfofundulus kuznetsovii DSM 6115]|uniref:Uncharacterized protein n=1 Tax=Desulfofundulus kuznetsovii (strain DSM 6115 / VKM B-1805 / 17) TaxID=760568 RepID=A0AAU8P954_DESK7|nr:hypothetical protein Desku_0832 [Desulfofundulus kuznetsovii DSM 6115]
MIAVEKEEAMELLYREMELEREIRSLQDELRRAGADLKALGERLQDPESVYSEKWPEEKIPVGSWQVNFGEYQRFCDIALLGIKVDQLHEKLMELDDVRKKLYFFRTREKLPEGRSWMIRQK